MASTESRTVVAVEVFVEQNVIAPMGIRLKFLGTTVHRPPSVLIAQKDSAKPAGYFVAHFKEVHHFAGPGGALDFKIIAVIQIELQQRPNNHDIYRKPHWASPVGVAAKHAGV